VVPEGEVGAAVPAGEVGAAVPAGEVGVAVVVVVGAGVVVGGAVVGLHASAGAKPKYADAWLRQCLYQHESGLPKVGRTLVLC